jgi:hypothetical protein
MLDSSRGASTSSNYGGDESAHNYSKPRSGANVSVEEMDDDIPF